MRRRTILTGAASLVLIAASFVGTGNAMSETPLHTAAEQNDAALITRLLAGGAKIDARDRSGATALLRATHANAIDAARVLIEAGANVNLADDKGVTPLQHARKAGYRDMENILAAAGGR